MDASGQASLHRTARSGALQPLQALFRRCLVLRMAPPVSICGCMPSFIVRRAGRGEGGCAKIPARNPRGAHLAQAGPSAPPGLLRCVYFQKLISIGSFPTFTSCEVFRLTLPSHGQAAHTSTDKLTDYRGEIRRKRSAIFLLPDMNRFWTNGIIGPRRRLRDDFGGLSEELQTTLLRTPRCDLLAPSLLDGQPESSRCEFCIIPVRKQTG